MLTADAKRQRTARRLRTLRGLHRAALDLLTRKYQLHDDTRAEVERLRAEVATLRAEAQVTYDGTYDEIMGLQAALAVAERKVEMVTTVSDALERENARLRETLGHYADAANWSESREGMWDDYYDAPGNGYDVARAALAGREREEGT